MGNRHQLDFSDIETIEIPFEISGKKYVLHEASGGAAKKYHNERFKRISFGGDGKVTSVKDLADLEPMLVSLCVFTEDGKPVTEATVESWPGKIVKRLFKTAKEISGIETELDDKSPEALLARALQRDDAAVTDMWLDNLPEEFEPLKKAVRQHQNKKNAAKEL